MITAGAGHQVFQPGYVAVAAGRVTAVAQGRPPRAPDVALPSGTLLPGFVDLQVNGYFAIKTREIPKQIWQLLSELPKGQSMNLLRVYATLGGMKKEDRGKSLLGFFLVLLGFFLQTIGAGLMIYALFLNNSGAVPPHG